MSMLKASHIDAQRIFWGVKCKTLHICRWHKGMHGGLKYLLCWPKEGVVFKSRVVLKVQRSKVWRPLPNSPPHSGGCSTCLMVSSPRRVLAQCGLNTAAEHNWYTGYCQESPVGNLSPEETHTLGCFEPIIWWYWWNRCEVELPCCGLHVRIWIPTSSSDRLSGRNPHWVLVSWG